MKAQRNAASLTEIVPGGRQNYTVKARLKESQSKHLWCHYYQANQH